MVTQARPGFLGPPQDDQPPIRRTKSDAFRVKELCDAAYNDTSAMRLRMMHDYALYRLEPFTWREVIADRLPRNTATFTGNDPKTLANTIIAIISEARITWRSPTVDQPEDIRGAGRAAEQLFHGLIQQVDNDQSFLVNTSLLEQFSFYIAIRGFGIVLHTLTKNEQGETMPRIEAWDPMNVYWGVSSDGKNTGNNRHGLSWAAHYQDLDAWRLDARFSDGRTAISGGVNPTYVRDDRPYYRVYDFYDREFNIVVVDDKVVSKTRHFGEGFVPITIVPVGPAPMIVDSQANAAYYEEFGESVFAHNRNLYPKINAILSTKYERVLRYLNPPLKELSRTGRFTIPSNVSNPFDRGQRFRLSTANEEDLVPLDEPALPRDAAEFEATVQIQTQKGGVPNVVHGQTGVPSSGYNTSLLLSSQRHILMPRINAIKRLYVGMERHLRRQFSTGYFEALHLQGEIDRRKPYNQLIEPSVISQAPAPIIDVRVTNPAELAQRVALAQAASTPGAEWFDLAYILDEVLEVDDPDSMMERLAVQRAKQALPQTQLYEAIKAAEEVGDTQLAQILMSALLQYMGGPPQPGQGQGPPGQGPPGQGQIGPATNAGGAPGAGLPNESTEAQLQGRPRPEGTP